MEEARLRPNGLLFVGKSTLLVLAGLLGDAKLALLRLESELHKAVLLLRLLRLLDGDNASPLVVLQVLLGESPGGVVGGAMHNGCAGPNSLNVVL